MALESGNLPEISAVDRILSKLQNNIQQIFDNIPRNLKMNSKNSKKNKTPKIVLLDELWAQESSWENELQQTLIQNKNQHLIKVTSNESKVSSRILSSRILSWKDLQIDTGLQCLKAATKNNKCLQRQWIKITCEAIFSLKRKELGIG